MLETWYVALVNSLLPSLSVGSKMAPPHGVLCLEIYRNIKKSSSSEPQGTDA